MAFIFLSFIFIYHKYIERQVEIIIMPFIFKVPPPVPVQVAFSGTGSIQTFNVPAGINTINVKMWGAGGGSGTWDATSRGGGGGFASGNLAVTPLTTLDIYVGIGGGYSTTGGLGGWPNGGKGGDGSFSNGGGGGGFSAVFASGDFTTPFIVAGGGGGGGTNDAWPGGGLQNWYSPGTFHGQLGSQVAGGSGGTTDGVNQIIAGSSGSFLAGGNGAVIGSGHGGGGGGGGYYGGGGGSAGDNSGFGAQGGGGSSYIGHVNLSTGQTFYNTDSANLWKAANESDPDFLGGTTGARGGALGNPGQGGRVVISYFT